MCLSRIMDVYLFTSDNQFGFKQNNSTDLCIYTVRSIIQYYNYHSSPVYTCFLDASKAFDRINHWTMFKQLILRNVPSILIRILCFWYRSQELCILWGNMRSSFLLFQMVFAKVEYYLLNYSLFIWTISLSY